MDILNSNLLKEEEIKRLQNEFNNAKPYRHLVVDNFLNKEFADSLYQNFPGYDKLNKHYKGYNEFKAEGSNFEAFHPDFLKLKNQLSSKSFYQWLSKVTGIEDVFITDDKLGAGLHQGQNGSFLDIHIDFNIHPNLNVHRRLNMLIYLQQNWKPEYNGSLELWNDDMTVCEKYVSPDFNRCVVFETNEISYHGYTKKLNLPEGISRKSFYAYFYTNTREDAVGYHDTVFKATPHDTAIKKVGTSVKESFKNFTKAQLKKIGIKL